MRQKQETTKDGKIIWSNKLRADLLRKFKAISVLQERSQAEIVEELLSRYIDSYEKKHGKLPE